MWLQPGPSRSALLIPLMGSIEAECAELGRLEPLSTPEGPGSKCYSFCGKGSAREAWGLNPRGPRDPPPKHTHRTALTDPIRSRKQTFLSQVLRRALHSALTHQKPKGLPSGSLASHPHCHPAWRRPGEGQAQSRTSLLTFPLGSPALLGSPSSSQSSHRPCVLSVSPPPQGSGNQDHSA